MSRETTAGNITIGGGRPLCLIAGPCVIEDADTTFEIAKRLKHITEEAGCPFIFKASYDKANRTSIQSFRGPGLEEGLDILNHIKTTLDVHILSDIHRSRDVAIASQVLDIIQIPAFLCRQTDFILEVAGSGRPVNVKKGQFLAPWDVSNIVEKIASTGNREIMITERGTMFGYNNLVVDFRGIKIMQDSTDCPVIFDATHSVQLPGGSGNRSSGQREFAPVLAKAAVAAGADGVFMEVHPNPDQALCDGPNSLRLESLPQLISDLMHIQQIVH